jgi:RNA polymerase sigma factor (sigma-70 family)
LRTGNDRSRPEADDDGMSATTIPSANPCFVDPAQAGRLLMAARDGEADALNRLIRVCEPLVRAQAARYARHPGDVDDIVQDVWERLLRNAEKIRNPDVLVAWLVTVTRRVSIDVSKRGDRSRPTEFDDRVLASSLSSGGTEDEAIQRYSREETAAGVREALGRINGADRTLLMLLASDERMHYREVSRRVHRPVGSLGPTRMRLLGHLRADPAVRRLRVVA